MIWRGKNGEVIRSPNAHTALVSKDTFDKVQQLLVDRRPTITHPRTVNSQYLLSPLLYCSRCGKPMIGVRVSQENIYTTDVVMLCDMMPMTVNRLASQG